MDAVRAAFPATLEIDYPDRELDRFTSFFRPLAVIPIAIVLSFVTGATMRACTEHFGLAAGGIVFPATALMLVFRQKYPRWWFDWNLELQRFANRVGVYLALMDDRYPATDEQQSVRLEYPHPYEQRRLNRWLPLVKWLLAMPHYVVLFFLDIGAIVAVVIAWFAILFTGRYPKGLFDFVEGVIRWHNRVFAYAFVLVTDEYPPFRLRP